MSSVDMGHHSLTERGESTILKVENVSKWFGALKAVDDATFDVPRARVTSLVGPNGAGKTTIFNLIAGSLLPDNGRVVFRSENVIGEPAYRRAHLGIARSFQDARLIDELAAWENLALGFPDQDCEQLFSSLRHPVKAIRSRSNLRQRSLELMEREGLGSIVDEPTGRLAYGQKKMLALLQVEATGADLLLLDEPTSGLDGPTLDRLVLHLEQLVDDGKTVLIVEHNMRLVRSFSQKMVFLNGGAVVAQGDPESLMARQDLRRIYFGETE